MFKAFSKINPKLFTEAFPSFASKKRLEARQPNPWLALTFGYKMGLYMCEHIFENPGVKDLISSNEEFDLVLGEIMMDESLLAGMAHRFKAPIVAFATTSPTHWANYLASYHFILLLLLLLLF